MNRILSILLLCALYCMSAHAQVDTINLSGHVHCGSDSVERCFVAMLQPSDSSVVAYTMTDSLGNYALQAATPLKEVLIKVTGFNIKRKIVRINAVSQKLDFNVEAESLVLREVQVKARRLWGNRDTLNYLVSSYIRDHDRTIGDVLKQLPGITIDDDGTIRYQGTPINHFYIENLDMLQGRYNLATQGIKAEDVGTVQVLENHEHVRALQDQQPSGHAAINLKLKEKAKDVWTHSADLGAGRYADGMLWDATLQSSYFSGTRQHLFRYSGDNMGRSYDDFTSHYGIVSSGGERLVDIVKHGAPPVGNSTFGYRHGVTINNLRKLSDSVTINYNLNYRHNYVHGNSYSQTTYILPDGNELLLTEDIADRTHTNEANLRLTYEKNTQRKFLYNTLSLFGQWNEGRGTILSSSTSPQQETSDVSVDQALHYRSLGVVNKTRLVNRTAKGGGLEWTSTNSLTSSPQALAVGGSSAARQDVRITELSTNNDFQLLRNMKRHSWTLSASAYLNAFYTSLTSDLVQEEVTEATHGDLDYLHVQTGLGPILQYVKGTFHSTLSVPFSLAYTNLNNANISGETTDDNRFHFNVEPSFILQWRANDNFTIDANAKYSSSETSWPQLLTANLMTNYRSLSRYRATINDSHGAAANVKVTYKDLFSSLFAYVEGGWKRAWSDIAYGTTLDDQAHTIIEAMQMPNHSNHYSLTAYGRKDFDWHTIQLELSATWLYGKSELLRQQVLTNYRTQCYVLHGTLAFDIVNGYRTNYSFTWQRSHSTSNSHRSTYTELNQHLQFNFRLLPSRLFLNFNADHTHNGSLESSKKDYIFLGAGLQFKISKKIELDLDGSNLTNIRTYTSRSIGDMEEYYTRYYLRPLSVMLTAHIYL